MFLPLALFALALVCILWHVNAWLAARDQERDETERIFQWRRFRRRMQTSSMLALAAAGMLAGQLVPYDRYRWVYVFVWSGVGLLTLWMAALAAADVLASRSHAAHLQREHLVEHARLKAELERLQQNRK